MHRMGEHLVLLQMIQLDLLPGLLLQHVPALTLALALALALAHVSGAVHLRPHLPLMLHPD